MPPMLMKHDRDPADVIRDKIGLMPDGKIPGFELFGNRVLVGIYERPKVTASGIHLADQTRDEDKHQGKAALVLMKGPTAFVSDKNYDFRGQNAEVGDWVALFVSEGRSIVIRGQLCRVIEDQFITLKIPAPDQIY